MFGIDIENKLNELKEGTFRKTFNGKTYDIEVKNIDNNTKLINVYYKASLIFSSNYYKDGFKKEGNTMVDDNKKITLEDLIEKMVSLSEGHAKLDNMTINVKESKKIDNNSSSSFKVEIEDNDYFYDFSIPFINEYYINIRPKNNQFYLYTFKNNTSIEKNNRTLNLEYNNQKFLLTNDRLKNLNTGKDYQIFNNNIINYIDDKHCIGYNLDNNKVYVYSKKNDAVGNDLENDYYKTVYNKDIAKATNICTDFLSTMKSKLKEKIDDKEFNDLIDNVKIPKVDKNYDIYANEITEIGNIFKNNIYNLNLLDNEYIINNIAHLITNANITEVDKKICLFKETVKYDNLKDLNTLKDLKNELTEIIKLKKKQDRTKKKILRNTDLDV